MNSILESVVSKVGVNRALNILVEGLIEDAYYAGFIKGAVAYSEKKSPTAVNIRPLFEQWRLNEAKRAADHQQ